MPIIIDHHRSGRRSFSTILLGLLSSYSSAKYSYKEKQGDVKSYTFADELEVENFYNSCSPPRALFRGEDGRLATFEYRKSDSFKIFKSSKSSIFSTKESARRGTAVIEVFDFKFISKCVALHFSCLTSYGYSAGL